MLDFQSGSSILHQLNHWAYGSKFNANMSTRKPRNGELSPEKS